MFRKKPQPNRFSGPDVDDIRRRIHSLDKSEMLDHMDTTISVVNRQISEFRRTRDAYLLDEIRMSSEVIYVLADALKDDSPRLVSRSTRQTREHY